MDKIFAFVEMAIKPGETDEFRAKAQRLGQIVRTDLTGTDAYEWFLTPDGRNCTVIEIYDGPEALAHHGRMVGKDIAALKQHIETQATFAGGLTPTMFEAIRERMPTAAFAGARLQGRLHTSAPGIASPHVGSRIFALARFRIKSGGADDFIRLAEQAFAPAADEPGTLAYEWFLNDARTECLTLEVYQDVAALGAHTKNVGRTIGQIIELVDSEVRLFGALPEELQAKLAKGLGSRYVAPQLLGVF